MSILNDADNCFMILIYPGVCVPRERDTELTGSVFGVLSEISEKVIPSKQNKVK